MSRAAAPAIPVSDRSSVSIGQAALVRVGALLKARAMLVIAVAAVLGLSLLGIPGHLAQDGWLMLLAGRAVAAHGIPTHDYFAHMTYGEHWVDQQWLAQLVMYELVRIGGLQLMTVLYVLVTAGAFAAAIAAARALGGEDLHVLAVALPGAFFYLVTAVSIRTQGLAYPLFVATLWLLASEARATSRSPRVYLVLPILVLWGNLHGSATLGAGMVGLYGLIELLRGLRARGIAGLRDARAWVLIVLAPLALLATPYGTGMIHYYRITLLNPQFGRMVTEWKPVTSVTLLALPLFAVAAGTAGVVGLALRRLRRVRQRPAAGDARHPVARSLTAFELLMLLVLTIGAVMAVRNVTWFGLGLLVLLPSIVTVARGGRPAPLRRSRLNGLLALASCVIVTLATVAVLSTPAGWFTGTYATTAIPKLRALIARRPKDLILADVRYADWLVWEDPRLFSGRVAYDTSFELLSRGQLAAIADLAAHTAAARHLIARYAIWVLSPATRHTDRVLLAHPGVRVVTRTRRVIIATHPAGRL